MDDNGQSQTVLFVFVLVAMLVCASGMLLADSDISWVRALHKPAFLPVIRFFPSIWTALYVGAALAGWRVWRIVVLRSVALGLYAGQMGIGLLWFFFFFHQHQLGVAMAVRLTQLILLLFTNAAFWRIDVVAGVIILLNLAWWSLGALLNMVLWHLNY